MVVTDPILYLDQQEHDMARRRHETGLKYQQRIENEQQRAIPSDQYDRGEKKPAFIQPAPVPPGVTQLFETVAPPPLAPRETQEP